MILQQGASDAKVGKKLNDLEGRLYRANSKYNQQLTANSALREEIETLRIKHRNFQNKDKKYQKGNYSNHSFMSAKMSHIHVVYIRGDSMIFRISRAADPCRPGTMWFR